MADATTTQAEVNVMQGVVASIRDRLDLLFGHYVTHYSGSGFRIHTNFKNDDPSALLPTYCDNFMTFSNVHESVREMLKGLIADAGLVLESNWKVGSFILLLNNEGRFVEANNLENLRKLELLVIGKQTEVLGFDNPVAPDLVAKTTHYLAVVLAGLPVADRPRVLAEVLAGLPANILPTVPAVAAGDVPRVGGPEVVVSTK